MAKDSKSKQRKRSLDQEDEEAEDSREDELQEELAVLQAIQAEKQRDSADIHRSSQPSTYNKEGLMRCLQDMETAGLPFLETMQICDFPLDSEEHEDLELDDLNREVSAAVTISTTD